MNRNYAKPKADMTPEYAPDVLEINGRKVYNPKAVHCKIAGYLPLSPDYPDDPAPEGKHYERTGTIEFNGAGGYRWVYRLVDDPLPPPRVFETADLVEALMEEGVWDTARAWIVEQGMLDLVLATKEFDETNANFQAGKAALQETLGWTDAEVEELLAKCVKEDY